MDKKPVGMWTDTRSGKLYLRRKIPQELRSFIGKGELYKVSLGTSDPLIAKSKFKVAEGEFEKLLANARVALAGSGLAILTQAQAQDLAKA